MYVLDSLALPSSVDELLQRAMDLFGFEELSAPQKEIIDASIAGHDVFGIMPTGGGKSACFQLPGIVTGSKTLVISPLIALQEDQVKQLRQRGIKAFAFHSGMEESAKKAVLFYYRKLLRPGEASFLYISPELLLTKMFQEHFGEVGFDRIAVDEAHCVSTWGDSFRPDYQRIKVAVARLGIKHCSAFTATVDPKIEKDIIERIPLRPGFLKVEASPLRPNLEISVLRQPVVPGESQVVRGQKKFSKLLGLLGNKDYLGAAIVYVNSRRGAESLFARMHKMKGFLKKYGHIPYLFHADVEYDVKVATLKGFSNDRRPLVFATSAFGMGVNRPDVRQVIHYNTPTTLIDYAQQIGRGGRDGKPTLCTLLFSSSGAIASATGGTRIEVPDYYFVTRRLANIASVLEKLSPKRRKAYTIGAYRSQLQRHIQKEYGHSRDQFINGVNTSISLLLRAGFLTEGSEGLVVRELVPGSSEQLKLMELTQMHERMAHREWLRVERFFAVEHPDQKLLWEILKTE